MFRTGEGWRNGVPVHQGRCYCFTLHMLCEMLNLFWYVFVYSVFKQPKTDDLKSNCISRVSTIRVSYNWMSKRFICGDFLLCWGGLYSKAAIWTCALLRCLSHSSLLFVGNCDGVELFHLNRTVCSVCVLSYLVFCDGYLTSRHN